MFLIVLKTSFITIASDPSVLAVLEKVIETSFPFNFADALEDIAVQTKLCFSHFLTFLAAVTIIDNSIYLSITCQSGMFFLAVTHSCQLLRHLALPLFIFSDSMFQLLLIFGKVELLYAQLLLFSKCTLLMQLLFHLSSVHLLLLAPHH